MIGAMGREIESRQSVVFENSTNDNVAKLTRLHMRNVFFPIINIFYVFFVDETVFNSVVHMYICSCSDHKSGSCFGSLI
jgi:hypothetical protein